MRPHHDTTPLDAAQVATAMAVPERTAQHWLACWFDLKVPGIARVRSRGRYGFRYAVDPDLIERWRRCALPEPRPLPRAA